MSADYAMSPETPARVTRVGLHVRLAVRLDEDTAEGLRAAVVACTVHNSIIDPPRIGVHIHAAGPGRPARDAEVRGRER